MKNLWTGSAMGRLDSYLFCISFLITMSAYAQHDLPVTVAKRLSLREVIELGKANNQLIKAVNAESSAVAEDYRDTKANALPTIIASSGYQRFTKLTLYESGLGRAHTVPKMPSQNGADAAITANFNLYSGGRQRALEEEQRFRRELAAISASEQTASTALQVAGQYLDIVRLTEQRKLLLEQVSRAQTRLKNISALFKNQKVTRSDLLRAELNLSAVQLGLQQAENDIQISNQKLNVLIHYADSVRIEPADSASMGLPHEAELKGLLTLAGSSAFAIRRADENSHIQGARIKNLRSNYLPTVSLYSAYGLTYPNTIFFPPVDQAYSIGFVGVKVQYALSSIYQNKHKVAAGRVRLKELDYLQENVKDNIKQEANGLFIKYQEALNRISINEKSIEQARVNLRIVNAKYLSQLALLTDLLDADNLFQETRYNLVLAQTNARIIYYRLLYTAGNF